MRSMNTATYTCPTCGAEYERISLCTYPRDAAPEACRHPEEKGDSLVCFDCAARRTLETRQPRRGAVSMSDTATIETDRALP
jgi:DNA-directed RNA polymerase subunit RPC12/RpoP